MVTGRQHETLDMISVFHVLAFVGCVVGLVVGALSGNLDFGWIGALLGVPIGAYLGLMVGRLPRVVAIFILQRHANHPEAHK